MKTKNNYQTTGHEAAQTEESKSKRKRLLIVGILLALLLGLGTCALLNNTPSFDAKPTPAVVLMPHLDANAQEITDRESLQAAMQEEADAHYFTLQVFPEADFSAANGEGSFSLMNPATNVYPIMFTITQDKTGEVLYESGAIMPGQQIQSLTLTTIPGEGSYSATVNVTIFNPDTQEKEGETQAKITLTVR